jgi:hypothetical protein
MLHTFRVLLDDQLDADGTVLNSLKHATKKISGQPWQRIADR